MFIKSGLTQMPPIRVRSKLPFDSVRILVAGNYLTHFLRVLGPCGAPNVLPSGVPRELIRHWLLYSRLPLGIVVAVFSFLGYQPTADLQHSKY